jgi:hypothetical protein
MGFRNAIRIYGIFIAIPILKLLLWQQSGGVIARLAIVNP